MGGAPVPGTVPGGIVVGAACGGMTWLGVTLGVTTPGVPVSLPGVVGVPLGEVPGEEVPELGGGVWLHASEC